MGHYKPRYLLNVVVHKQGEPIQSPHLESDDRAEVEAYLKLIDKDRDVFITDRGTEHRASTRLGAQARGYYGMRFSGSDIDSYILGKIGRAADEAMDRVDALTEEKRRTFEAQHRDTWIRTDQALILAAGLGHAS